MVDISSEAKKKGTKQRFLYEVLAVLVITVGLAYISPQLKQIAYVVPLVYVLVERKRRHRSWSEIGIQFKNFGKDFVANWYLFVIVAIIIQFVALFIAKLYWPDLLNHILGRLPSLNIGSLDSTIAIIIIVTFMEELIFRGLFQERLSWYVGQAPAILIASIGFGLVHYSQGPFSIVATDIALVILDGIFYGLIYARCRSIFVSWTAHVVADFVSLAILLSLFNLS